MSTKILSVSLPPETVKAINELAKKENRSRSQIMKEAIDRYSFESRWRKLRDYGDQMAKQLGLESDDDVEAFFG